MAQKLTYLHETASQTAGPFVHIGLAPSAAGFQIFQSNFGPDPANAETEGEPITVRGHIHDGAGAVVKDAMIEIWQANAAGKYNHPADRRDRPIDPNFRGWGRVCCDFESGEFLFHTIKPGSVTGRGGQPMAPHICFWIVARGINIGLHTRMYFGDEEAANAADPVMALIEQTHRRATLVALKSGEGEYTFDIHLQGDRETVFLDI